MDAFLQVFGEMSVASAVTMVVAALFLRRLYKQTKKNVIEQHEAAAKKDLRIQQVIDQAEQYPVWHQQSIDIRDKMDSRMDELGSKLDQVNKAIGELRTENSHSRATTCRYRILRFDDELRHGERHTKEHFDQVLEDITEYEKYCNDHPDYKNNKAELAISNVKRCYQHCTDERSFL